MENPPPVGKPPSFTLYPLGTKTGLTTSRSKRSNTCSARGSTFGVRWFAFACSSARIFPARDSSVSPRVWALEANEAKIRATEHRAQRALRFPTLKSSYARSLNIFTFFHRGVEQHTVLLSFESGLPSAAPDRNPRHPFTYSPQQECDSGQTEKHNAQQKAAIDEQDQLQKTGGQAVTDALSHNIDHRARLLTQVIGQFRIGHLGPKAEKRVSGRVLSGAHCCEQREVGHDRGQYCGETSTQGVDHHHRTPSAGGLPLP